MFSSAKLIGWHLRDPKKRNVEGISIFVMTTHKSRFVRAFTHIIKCLHIKTDPVENRMNTFTCDTKVLSDIDLL